MSSKYSRVTMQVKDTHRNEFEKGDKVVVRDGEQIVASGIVVRASIREVVIQDAKGWKTAYIPRFVELAA